MTGQSTTPAALTWSGVTARRMSRHALTAPATEARAYWLLQASPSSPGGETKPARPASKD